MSPRNQTGNQPRDLSRRTFFGWTGGLGAAVLVSACSAPSSTSGDDEKVTKASQDVDTIAFDYPFTFLPVFAGVTKFAKERANEKGVKLEQTSDNGRPDVQATNLTPSSPRRSRRSCRSRWSSRPPSRSPRRRSTRA